MATPIGGSMNETTAFFDEVEGVVNELQTLLAATGGPLTDEEHAAVLQCRELLMLAATALFETQMTHLGLLSRHGRVQNSAAVSN